MQNQHITILLFLNKQLTISAIVAAEFLIAAQCKLYDATLATYNPTDYPQKDINLLSGI